ncbi:MAG: efflux RND transporter permease subunit [Selenomonadaceae bacterium]|nr:efflux RND transporter permease subunit [Selenomonadaceae bacterium]
MRNLTELALKNRSLVWYFVVMIFLGGIFFYQKLGRMEDPAFTIRQMVVSCIWAGATTEEMELQVTDKLEKTLQDIPGLDFVKSYSKPGVCVIFVNLRDDFETEKIRSTWRDVRNYCSDIKSELPSNIQGIYFNDRFDDVYGTIYALTGDGFDYEDLRRESENLRRKLLAISSVQRVELIGEQTEKIYVEFERSKLESLGISPTTISNALSAQNSMTPSGKIETESDNVYIRFTGNFEDVDEIRNLPIRANGKIFRLEDVAAVERRFIDPPDPKMFFNGEPCVGIAVSMTPGGNILELGESEDRLIAEVQKNLPLGLEIHEVANQPQVVQKSIGEFVRTLFEAIVIVLAVSFLSLGLRTGFVVALCIPLVLAGTFVSMYAGGIDLHKVSLGALIISLGLLVDDEIIAVEMMSVQLERGLDRFKAACYAFEATAKPMLTGTLITCSGFIPIAFSHGLAAEFCSALFPVISAAMLISWIVSVCVAPMFGFYLIRVEKVSDEEKSGFYRVFRKFLESCLNHRITVLLATGILFAISIYAFTFTQKEFFPTSIRPEILVDLRLPAGASFNLTESRARDFAKFLDKNNELIDHYSYYVGEGSPRFVLTLLPQLQFDNYMQFIVVAKSEELRKNLEPIIQSALDTDFADLRSQMHFIQTGPPADYPIMLRVSGDDKELVKKYANQVAQKLREDPNNLDVHLNWSEQGKSLKIEIDNDKIHALGISRQTAQQILYTEITGAKVAEFYDGDRTLDIDLRLVKKDRENLATLENLPIYIDGVGHVPLSQIASIKYSGEDVLIWRYNLKPTITVQANIAAGTANDAAARALESVSEIETGMPFGYSIEPDGSLSKSNDSMKFLLIPVPFMLFAILTFLMLQLQSAKQILLTFITAPLGMIGVAWGMLLFNQAVGFVAYLGILALFGMIIRNSVILMDQIQKHLAAGENPHDAIVDSAILRFRPIMLTAAAAILGMIPLMRSEFWGPMAIAIASGLLVATVLTLIVLPVIYAVAYRVERS